MKMALTAIVLAAAGPACAGSAFEQLLQESGGKEVAAVTAPAPALAQPRPLDIYSSESYRTILPDCAPGHRYGLDASGACIKETRRNGFLSDGSCAKSATEVVDPGYCRFERIARQVKAAAGRCRFKNTRDVKYTMTYGLGS